MVASLDRMIDNVVEWEEAVPIPTGRGLRMVRRAIPNPRFWELWKACKGQLRDLGVQVQQIAGDWTIEQCLSPEGAAPAPHTTRQVNTAGLLDHQPKPVALLCDAIEKFKFAVDASDTGIGKTYVACAVARELCLKPLVICPKTVIPSWRQAFKDMGVKEHDVINYEKVRRGTGQWLTFDELDYPKWLLPRYSIIIMDEGHRMKTAGSLNSKLGVAAIFSGHPVLVLSATLFESPLHMKATGFGLKLHSLNDFFGWCKAHGCYKNRSEHWEFNGSRKILHKLHDAIFGSGRGIRVKREEVKGFPETQVTVELLDMGDGIQAAYKEMGKSLKKLADTQARDKGSSQLTVQLRARQKIELLKVPTLIEMSLDAMEEGFSVLIFVNFNETIDQILQKVGKLRVVSIRGGQSGGERQSAIDAFQCNESNMIVCNSEAGGVGISLHDIHGGHPRLSLICPAYNGATIKQVLGRPHRAGAKTKSIQKILYAANSIEEDVAKAVKRKLRNIDTINDGDLAKL